MIDFNIDEIDVKQLNLSSNYYFVEIGIKANLAEKQEPSDELLSWLINSPPIYAAKEDEELKKTMKIHAETYLKNKERSIKVVKQLKKEFYNLMCTDSVDYEKERSSFGNNINVVITGISSAIATKFTSLEIGVITSFVTNFIIIAAKMGKNAMCESFKPD